MTKEQKQQGMTLEDFIALQSATTLNKRRDSVKKKRRTLREIGKEILEREQEEKDISSKPLRVEPPAVKERPVFIEKQIIKEVRILDKEQEKPLREIIEEEYASGTWEWKEVPLDKEFRRTLLDQLGKEGWKFAFVLERDLIDPNSKKPDAIMLHRLAKK
jgi:hypothetical protein